ncbi:MAG: DivIVA domain-containing protein [Coraliomargarita sp.]
MEQRGQEFRQSLRGYMQDEVELFLMAS